MGIILFNRSPYPDSMMHFFAETAYNILECRGDVVVKVGNGSARGYSGLCTNTQRTRVGKTIISTHGEIRISPTIRKTGWTFRRDCIDLAIENFKVFLHEFNHCKEYQDEKDYGVCLPMDRRNAYKLRRGKHDQRPQEIRAHAAEEHYYKAAQELPEWEKLQDEILNFAMMLTGN